MKLKFLNIVKQFALIPAIICLVSCGGESKKESGAQSTAPKVKLAFMTNATADFWSYGKAGAEKAASEHDDIEIEFKMGDGTAAKQREICDSLLVRGFKGIAISPPNPKGQQEMLNS